MEVGVGVFPEGDQGEKQRQPQNEFYTVCERRDGCMISVVFEPRRFRVKGILPVFGPIALASLAQC